MPHYAALDVSNDETAIHVLDEAGRTVWRGKRPSDPEALATALRRHAPELVRVGLETGFLTPWLYHSRKERGVDLLQKSGEFPMRYEELDDTAATVYEGI
jgi:transposase